MGPVRALERRLARVERKLNPKPSPFATMFGTFDVWVAEHVLPEIETGLLDRADMIEIVAILRIWESDGTWNLAHAS